MEIMTMIHFSLAGNNELRTLLFEEITYNTDLHGRNAVPRALILKLAKKVGRCGLKLSHTYFEGRIPG